MLSLMNSNLEETITSWVVKPWIIVWASYASLKVQCLSGNFLRGQFTSIWNPTCWRCRCVDATLLLPWVEIFNLRSLTWVLDPLNDLSASHEIDVVVIRQNFINPIQESIQKFGIILQPCSVIVKAQRGTI